MTSGRGQQARAAASPQPAADARPPGSGVRALTEWLVLLALSVTIFRAFAVEGYMISTGSMAPCLLGRHREVTCPVCGYWFALGAASDTGEVDSGSASAADGRVGESAVVPETATCPMCGKAGLEVDPLSPTEGDQLLVHKQAFAWRDLFGGDGPRRWEVAVFRNPADAMQAYVKRVVGLPGERIELIDGDVYADGELQRKSLSSQLGTRIALAHSDYRPADDDPDWKPRWFAADENSGWTDKVARFVYQPPQAPDATGSGPVESVEPDFEWLHYRHWIRRGGGHQTSVELAAWPSEIDPPNPLFSQIEYDPDAQQLTCFGAMSYAQWQRWDAAAGDEAFRDVFAQLYRRSHVAAITDATPYNRDPLLEDLHFVRDLMLELTLECSSNAGEFAIEMTDGTDVFRSEFDVGRGEVRLLSADNPEPLATARLPGTVRDRPVTLLMSTFDRQLVLAIDGELLCAPVPLAASNQLPSALSRPVRLGAKGARLAVAHLALYRDVYYTPATEREPEEAYQLADDEYFMLGDNSAVSIDSRHWERPGVPRELLIGKPLLVHLPSRPGTIQWGGRTRQVRVPDLRRIRYIR